MVGLHVLRGAIVDVLVDALVLDEMPAFADTLDQLKVAERVSRPPGLRHDDAPREATPPLPKRPAPLPRAGFARVRAAG